MLNGRRSGIFIGTVVLSATNQEVLISLDTCNSIELHYLKAAGDIRPGKAVIGTSGNSSIAAAV